MFKHSREISLKILFVTPYTPIRVRPYELIRYLSRNHEITVVYIVYPTWTARFLNDVKTFCKQVHAVNLNRNLCLVNSLAALPSKKPMSVAYFASNRMKIIIERLVQDYDFDIIHTEFIRAAPFTADLQGIPKVFDSVDCLTLAYERGWRNTNISIFNRIVSLEEWIKMRTYEPKMLRSFNRILVSSPIDRKFLASESSPPVEIIQNGIDSDYFQYKDQDRDINHIVFVGQMNYYVNVDSILHFCDVIFPKIQKQLPDVRFSIVGMDPKQSVRNLSKNPAIEVTGFVPDIRPYLSRAAVFVCPLIAGSGIQNKLLQAMAIGTPIVTTSIATQAMQVKDGVHLLVADEPQQFAEAVVSFLTNINLRKRLSENAKNYIQEYHDWEAIGKKLDAIYESLL